MSSVNKRAALLIIWIIVLLGIYQWVVHLNLPNTAPTSPTIHLDSLTSANLSKNWSQMMARAVQPPLGNPSARYTMVEFGDFECPQCIKMRPVLEKLVSHSGGEVNMYFFEHPFPPSMHPYAEEAAAASLIAASQGKFWPMYNQLYINHDNLEPGYYNGYAAAAGLNVPQFEAAMKADQDIGLGEEDTNYAQTLDILVTPTVLVRDNKTQQISIYVGSDSAAPGAVAGFQGVEQLAENPPWSVRKNGA